MAVTMIVVRAKVARQPTSIKKIILPPIFMSTGALMFILPAFRLTMLEASEAIGIGIVFSIFLMITTKFEVKQRNIYLIPSKAFIFVLFGLLVIRIAIKLLIGSTISFGETSGMFFLLAFGMIVSWRIAMLIKYQQLRRGIENKKHTLSNES